MQKNGVRGHQNENGVRRHHLCPIPSRITFRPHHANDPRQNDAAGEDIAGPSQGAVGRCSTQGAEDPVDATQTRGAHSLEQGPGKGAGHPIKAPQTGRALA